MKPFSDSITNEVAEEIKELDEKVVKSRPHDPPAILIMRRKSIRQFPNGQRVALYNIDKLNKVIMIPYDDMEAVLTVGEEVEELEENVMHHLNDIVSSGSAKRVKFQIGRAHV